ncbi:hypothetical protein [Bacillus sp. NPDC093026]|uniref:hypothetical protein n=1 Tax=Bacillus sp. NPDC093026 TaxID=3363948 RepID=UPI003804AEA4
MFDLFSDLSLHFERYFILNEYSMKIIQWCVLGLFVLYVTIPLCKGNKNSYLFYAGIALRVVLLSGMTLEMIHQVNARDYTVETFEVLTSFMQFLIYGYVLLASLYYVISLSFLKNKGLFFTFDLSVLLLPLFQTVFIVLAEIKRFYDSGDVGLVGRDLIGIALMCGFTISLLFLFFRLFWHQKRKDMLLFYGLILAALLYIFYPSISKYQLQSSLKSIVIIVAAAGSFMTIYLLDVLLKNKVRWRQLMIGSIAVFFMLLLNPIMNVPHALFQITKTEITDTFSDDDHPLSAKSAKELAMKFVPANHQLHVKASDQPIEYHYLFVDDEYEVNISAFTGELKSYSYQGHAKGKVLTDKEYKKRTIEFFERSGRTIDLDRIHVEIEKGERETTISLQSKMPDDEHESLADATWEGETLLQAQYTNSIFRLKDLDRIKITEKDIAKKINNIYDQLKLHPPAYQITSIDDFYFDWNHLVKVKAADQSVFQFNGSTKELVEIQLSKATLNQRKEKISDDDLITLMGRQPSEVVKKSGSENHTKYFFDHSSSALNMTKEASEIRLSWQSESSLPHMISNHERDLIYQQVLKRYNPYMIYKKQIKPVRMINKEGEMRISWFVIIQTFGANEHEIYEVNGRTKEVHRFDR